MIKNATTKPDRHMFDVTGLCMIGLVKSEKIEHNLHIKIYKF